MQVLYEDEAIKALYYPRDSDRLCVTFSEYVPNPPAQPFGVPFLQSQNVSVLAIVAKQNHWYQLPDFPSLLIRLMQQIPAVKARHIACYGSSMGGYAAFTFAGHVGASRAIAISPQRSIWKEHGGDFERRFGKEAERFPAVFGDAFAHRSPACQYFCFYDTALKMDALHLRPYARLENFYALAAPFSGHPSGPVLLVGNVLQQAVSMILDTQVSPNEILRRYGALRRAHRRNNLTYARQAAVSLRVLRKGDADVIDRVLERLCDPLLIAEDKWALTRAEYHFLSSHKLLQLQRKQDALLHAEEAHRLLPEHDGYRRHLEVLRQSMPAAAQGG